MIIQIIVEDSLKEVIESPGAKLAIETACHKRILELRDAWLDKQSRQSVLSRGYRGTSKEGV